MGFSSSGDSARCRIWFNLRRVRNVLSVKVNSGPVLVGCLLMKWMSADVGHNVFAVGHKRITHPWRKGSHLDVLIKMVTWLAWIVTSDNRRLTSLLNDFVVGKVNSADRRKPKNAVVKAAQSINLSVAV